NKCIVIKPADKGSITVIMDRNQYVKEANRQLNNPQYYQKLDKPIFPQTSEGIRKSLDSLLSAGYINKKQINYLMGDNPPRPRQFYLLPKIHKAKETWPTEYMPPGRPIVSDCGSESYKIAEYLDYYLNPLSTKHATIINLTFSVSLKWV
uniref:Uncharacterized protein n=1 Tax=Pygocentrus nattereri TaxID=42514 RepID=A0AAR2JWK9_PYGNA